MKRKRQPSELRFLTHDTQRDRLPYRGARHPLACTSSVSPGRNSGSNGVSSSTRGALLRDAPPPPTRDGFDQKPCGGPARLPPLSRVTFFSGSSPRPARLHGGRTPVSPSARSCALTKGHRRRSASSSAMSASLHTSSAPARAPAARAPRAPHTPPPRPTARGTRARRRPRRPAARRWWRLFCSSIEGGSAAKSTYQRTSAPLRTAVPSASAPRTNSGSRCENCVSRSAGAPRSSSTANEVSAMALGSGVVSGCGYTGAGAAAGGAHAASQSGSAAGVASSVIALARGRVPNAALCELRGRDLAAGGQPPSTWCSPLRSRSTPSSSSSRDPPHSAPSVSSCSPNR